jgi:hypothetical protein
MRYIKTIIFYVVKTMSTLYLHCTRTFTKNRVKWAKSPHWAMMPHHEFLRNRCTRKQHMLHSLKFFQ